MQALVSADLVVAVLEAYLDRISDAARRLGCPPGRVAEMVERSGAALVELCARNPEQVVDLAGRWFGDTRMLAARDLDPVLPAAGSTPAVLALASGPAEEALAALDERRRFALLLRDSYDLAPIPVAVALGLSTTDAATVVAEARIRLLEVLDGVPAPSLAGHRPVAGVSLGTLGALSDGSSDGLGEYDDPALPARRRHVGSCATCAAVLDAQTRARASVGGLPILALADDERATVLARLTAGGVATLPTEEEVLLAAERPEPPLTPLLVGLALGLALILGVAVGAATSTRNAAGGPAAVAPSPLPSDTTLPDTVATSDAASPTPSGTPTPSPTPTPTPSPTPSASAVPTASASATPTASARASARPRPRRTPPSRPLPGSAVPVLPAPATPTTSASPSTTPVGATLTLSPTSGPQGTVIAVRGSGFTPLTVVTVTYERSTSGTPAQVRTEPDGTFSATITADDTRNSTGLVQTPDHAVGANDGTHTATATFTQTS